MGQDGGRIDPLGHVGLDHVGASRLRTDRIDPDAETTEFQRGDARDPAQRPFGRAVGGDARLRAHSIDRGDVDDRATAPLLHEWRNRPDPEKGADLIDANQTLEVLGRRVLERRHMEEASVVHEHVDASEAIPREVDDALPTLRRADVEVTPDRAFTEVFRHCADRVRLDVPQNQSRALGRTEPCGGFAGSASSPGDDDDFSLESAHGCHLLYLPTRKRPSCVQDTSTSPLWEKKVPRAKPRLPCVTVHS